MKKIWSELLNWFIEKELLEELNLREGAQISEIERLEKKLSIKLPQSFVELYSIADGQEDTEESCLGIILGFPMLSISQIEEELEIWKEISDAGDCSDYSKCIDGKKIKDMYANPLWIPLIEDGSGSHIGLDLDPNSEGTKGQIINFGRNEFEKFVIADSLEDFFELILKLYQNGDFRISTEETEIVVYPKHSTLLHPTEFLKKFKGFGLH